MSGSRKRKTERIGVDRLGRTALHNAVIDQNIESASRLIADGADPNVADDHGWTPLHFAAQHSSESIARILLGAGADVAAKDRLGNTALFRAVFSSRGDGGVIKLLLAAGADPHEPNASGVSPFALAGTIANYDVRRFFDTRGS